MHRTNVSDSINKNGRRGPYRQASPSPAGHHPGARSARRPRCLSMVSQTARGVTMNHRSFASAFAFAASAYLALAGQAAAGEQVPFKGSLAGTVTITPIIGDPVFDVHVEIEGAGNATHLGDFSLSIPHDVDRRTPPSPGIAVGEYLFTAANGDELYAEFTGEATLIAPGFLSIVETATITGGTGRFAGATGSFVCERLFDIAAGTTVGSFDGTISRPGP